jgi:hypothetical protein
MMSFDGVWEVGRFLGVCQSWLTHDDDVGKRYRSIQMLPF